jgi:2-amino-4-hydroxy-6-hydroxymethyldihydropteridine diphosphokinase
MGDCLIGLGSNLGDRQANLARAIEILCATPRIENVEVSRFLPTSPVGGPPGQGDFLNAAARLTTGLAPLALLDALLDIESQLGRLREVRWGPRTIDLDLLLYNDEVIDTPRLIVPHPRMAERAFVLVPACEIAADMRHPVLGLTIRELLEQLPAQPA